MVYEALLVAVAGGVATVTLNRPRVLNALNALVFDELERVFMDLAGDEAVRVVLLTGAGEKAFAAGADINEIRADRCEAGGGDGAAGADWCFGRSRRWGSRSLRSSTDLRWGAGVSWPWLARCGLRAMGARLGLPEIRLGLIPGYGGTQRLPRLVGTSTALKMMLTGEMVGAAEALRMGLVDEVVGADRLAARGEELAGAIASGRLRWR